MSEYELPPSGMLRSPRTVAEWRLCKPGHVIQLMGIELEITEENYGPFMKELSWYIDWYLGDRLGDWLMPNYNPSGATRFGDAVTKSIHCEWYLPDSLQVCGSQARVLGADEDCFSRQDAVGMTHSAGFHAGRINSSWWAGMT